MPPTYTWHFRASFRKMDEGGKIILRQNLGEGGGGGAKGVRETVHPVGGIWWHAPLPEKNYGILDTLR